MSGICFFLFENSYFALIGVCFILFGALSIWLGSEIGAFFDCFLLEALVSRRKGDWNLFFSDVFLKGDGKMAELLIFW